MRRSNSGWRWLLLAWALTGCTSRLGALKPVSVDVVEQAGQKEIAGRPRDPRYGAGLLRLRFSSPVDFFALSKRRQYHMSIDIRWCGDKRSSDISDGYSYFYMGEREVQGSFTPDPPPMPLLSTDDGKAYRYYAYLRVSQLREIRPENRELDALPSYDLVAQPRDVCLRVYGGNMLGMHGFSEPAVFSAQMIEAALKSAGP